MTKINFEDGADNQKRATSVTFASASGAQTYNISANNEIIISAGVIGSPQLLQVSGIGAASMLQDLGMFVTVISRTLLLF